MKKNNNNKIDMMKNKERMPRVRSTVYLSGMDKTRNRASRREEERIAMKLYA